MEEYFVVVQVDFDPLRTADIRVEASCAYDARMKYKNSGGRFKIVSIRPCKRNTSESL